MSATFTFILCIYTMDIAVAEQKAGVKLKTTALPEQPRLRCPKSSLVCPAIGVTDIAQAALLHLEYQ